MSMITADQYAAIARILFEEGLFEESRYYWSKVLELEPAHPAAVLHMKGMPVCASSVASLPILPSDVSYTHIGSSLD